MFKIIKKEGAARRAVFETPHGTVQMPAFMNVATCGAIKGAVSAFDLKDLKCQVQLCNTYHLHLRPGDETVKALGGLHAFTGWDGPILTDSGGFQVFSLSKLRRIKEEGVYFASHIDGRKLFIGPEQSMQIQSNLGSTIAMAFDECVENPAAYAYAKASCERTTRWLYRCKEELARLNSLPDTVNPKQMLFGINQGCTFDDLRIAHMKDIAKLDLDGYAIGGLAVGEPTEEMYRIGRGGTRRRHVSDHRGRRTSYAGGQAAVSHGRRHPGKHFGGGAPRCRSFRLRHAGTQCQTRTCVHLERTPQHAQQQICTGYCAA